MLVSSLRSSILFRTPLRTPRTSFSLFETCFFASRSTSLMKNSPLSLRTTDENEVEATEATEATAEEEEAEAGEPLEENKKKKKREPATHTATETTSDPGKEPSAGPTRALFDAVRQIEKSFGRGTIQRLGASRVDRSDDREEVPRIRVVPTGSLSLDLALGVGGLPRGRIVEIFGPEMSGKTTLALQVIAQAQKQGGICTFVDAEHALDASYASRIGVNVSDLYVSQPDCGEQALEIVDTLVRSGAVDIVVVDSVAALVPRAELEGDMGDHHIGLQARLMSQALRKLTANISRSKCIVIFINQIRMKVGVLFGSPETTPGGNALKFYSSVRLDIRKVAHIKRGEHIIGNQVRVKVAKNKLAPPFRQVEFDLEFGRGINRASELIDLGVHANIIDKAGSWFSFGDVRLGQGKDRVKQFLEENQDVCHRLEEQIRLHFQNANAMTHDKREDDREVIADDDFGMEPEMTMENRKKR